MKVWLVLFSSRPQGNLKALFFSFCIHKKKDLALSFIAQLYYNTLPSFSYFFRSVGFINVQLRRSFHLCLCMSACLTVGSQFFFFFFSFCLYLIFFLYVFIYVIYNFRKSFFFYWFVRPLWRVFSHIFG